MKGNSLLFDNYSIAPSSYDSYDYFDDRYSSSPLNGESQPFQKEYSVYSKMKEKDIRSGVYKDDVGYAKNPTAKTLDSLLDGNYIVDKHFNKKVPYVVTTDGNVVIGDRNGNGKTPSRTPTPHPTLIGGTDPKVRMAGILDIRGGKIYLFDDRSGHYRPNPKSMIFAEEAFAKYPKHKRFKGGK
ncbi:MAG: hypothetical protein MJ228_03000 [Bacilli bacterium]|nr:hypothetical protein [Bacilli bacterium]